MSIERMDPEQVEFDVRTDELLVNMGPQHPSTHGVLRLILRTDGEVVVEAVPYIGYLHRSAEKIGESVSARQWIPYTDRMDYLAAMNMNLGWAMTVEKLLGLEVPEKAKHLRVIVCELNRIATREQKLSLLECLFAVSASDDTSRAAMLAVRIDRPLIPTSIRVTATARPVVVTGNSSP